jgi:hypothetical protein
VQPDNAALSSNAIYNLYECNRGGGGYVGKVAKP